MIEFDPNDPFPLLTPGTYSYAEAQAHARDVDEWLGLRTDETESALGELPEDQQLWLDLPIQAMLTPYVEIREMLSRFDKETALTFVDLGAGYGRMGFVIDRHFPKWKFIGYEYVRARVEAAQNVFGGDRARVRFEVADLKELTPETGDVYFIYDYGTREAIQKTLGDLQSIAQKRRITVIGRGRASRDAIERDNPWLSQVIKPEHFPHYSLYRSR